MSSWLKRVRVLFAAFVLVGLCGGAAQASPLYIGNFSWIDAADGSQTLAVDTFGFDPWPTGLALYKMFATYSLNGSSGEAFFDGDFGACAGSTITLDAGGLFYQSPGDFASGCNELAPLPQDMQSATLNFAYDPALGEVYVNPLGAAYDVAGVPTREVQQILFKRAEDVPEPSTLMLIGTGLLGSCVVRRRRRRA